MAWRRGGTLTLWSHQALPSPRYRYSLTLTLASRPKRKCGRVSEVAAYFPASCQHLFGTLPGPMPPVDNHTLDSGISGRFSVSKWIYMNGGDAGLKLFFERVCGALVPGGTFVATTRVIHQGPPSYISRYRKMRGHCRYSPSTMFYWVQARAKAR
ncbi:hypothetical protein F5888DRAFT_1191506 [Russula emetica]|nr:hypothetical protein F5888DRAFT_1191506 [Russula emetica]